MKANNFTSAATFPVKLLHNDVIINNKIVPYHVTLLPTNVCNEHCAECFCDNRNKTQQLSYGEIKNIVTELTRLGTKAISLSGGGEPDCHPEISGIINYIFKQGMDVALVTNGKNLKNISTEALERLQWIRVSGTSSRPVNLKNLKEEIKRAPYVDWGLSYVLSPYEKGGLVDAIEFVNEHKLTHLRVVSDMMQPDENRIPEYKKNIKLFGMDDSRVIWQERTKNEPGCKDCLVYLLHPIIDTNGDIQPCCGIHFATEPPAYDFGKTTAICHWKDYFRLLEKQKPYDGRNCKICQYMSYNHALNMLKETPKHGRFV